MPRRSVDLIEWDGRRFCVLMEPYLFIFEPSLRDGQQFFLGLLKVISIDGHEIPPDRQPLNRIQLAQEITLRKWQEWDARTHGSLLRQPAIRLHVDQDYETVKQHRPVADIIKHVFDRKRADELAKIARDANRRRQQGDTPE